MKQKDINNFCNSTERQYDRENSGTLKLKTPLHSTPLQRKQLFLNIKNIKAISSLNLLPFLKTR